MEKIELKKDSPKNEVNSGIYFFTKKELIGNIKAIRLNLKKKEYFFTDIIEIFYRRRQKLGAYQVGDYREILAVNSQKDLALVAKIMNLRLLDELMGKGITVVDPQTTFISHDLKVGKNSIIYPFTFIENNVIIGRNCRVGPFAHLRPNTVLKDESAVGNFIEVCRSVIGRKVKAKHFGYLGDTIVGESANIGAGTVTANYNGKKKNKTVIKKKAFIGSDTVIVAPAVIGEGAITGAGCVVTKDVGKKEVVAGVPARRLRKRK